MKKQLTTVLLLIAMLAAVGCSESDTTTDTDTTASGDTGTTTAAETRDPLLDDLGEFDFGGYEYRVHSVTYDPASALTLFDPEEQNGDILNDALWKRNREIEERFNIKFVTSDDTWANNYKLLQSTVSADENAFDMIQLINREAFASAINGLLMPTSELTYLNPEKSYYMHDVNEQLKIAGKTFFFYSEESIHTFERSCCLLFNQQIAADYDLDNYYDLVRKGKWTIDKMYKDARLVTADLDGDSSMGNNDQYGIIGCADYLYASIYNGAGELTIRKDKDGIPYFAAQSSERLATIIEGILNERNSGDHFRITGRSDFKTSLEEFSKNMGLFTATVIGRVQTLRTMETDYGLLPFPKYDEEQDQYYSRVIDGWLHVVPITNPDPERTSVIMEALASGTARHIIPAYYDNVISMKALRDDESIEMLDIIRATRIIDLGECPWYATVRSPYSYELLNDQTVQFASLNASIAPQVEALINDAIAALEALD